MRDLTRTHSCAHRLETCSADLTLICDQRLKTQLGPAESDLCPSLFCNGGVNTVYSHWDFTVFLAAASSQTRYGN